MRETNQKNDLKPTGERYLPWAEDPITAYEHLHRYAYVSRFVMGKRVLDLACGEGYGSALLALTADAVVGIDIDQTAVHHAREKYRRGNLQFAAGSITEIPLSGSFDVIVCFEVLEHILEQDQLLAGAKRLLKPEGLLVISTPNRAEYRKLEPSNPFHVQELDFDEFKALLARFFRQVQFLGQRVQCGSSITSPDRPLSGSLAPLAISCASGEFVLSGTDTRPPVYFIGVASDAQIPAGFAGEILVDGSDAYFKEMARIRYELEETLRSQGEALAWREEQTRLFQGTIRSQGEALAWREEQTRQFQGTIQSHEQALAWRVSQIEALEARMRALEASRSWRLARKILQYRDRIFPPQSLRRRIYDRLINQVHR